MDGPLESFVNSLNQSGIGRVLDQFARMFPDSHLKELEFEFIGPGREVVIHGRRVINFGSDSFLGLDRDPRVQDALKRGIDEWGSHSGASRAFASVRTNTKVENRLAQWMGCEDCLIYPSVTLANLGAIPGLVGKHDLIAVDEFAHNSIHDGVRLARGSGIRTVTFPHDNVGALDCILAQTKFRFALVCVDGIYSMSGTKPPLVELDQVCRRRNAILYVDDAHGTGVIGPQGIGTVRETLGNYDNVLVAGSLSKAFSCMGAFIGCPSALKLQLKIRSNTYIFGGPVAPCYFEAITTVLDILQSREYAQLISNLHQNLTRFCDGAISQGFDVCGGHAPIVTLPIGDEELTLTLGKLLFDQGYYVQSVIFPAVPYRAGVLRIQINANHEPAQIDGLVAALGNAKTIMMRQLAA